MDNCFLKNWDVSEFNPTLPSLCLNCLLIAHLAIGARRRSLDVVVYVGDDSLRLYVVSSFDSFVSWVGEGYTLAVRIVRN